VTDNAQPVELTSVIAPEAMRSRFNWALGVGAPVSAKERSALCRACQPPARPPVRRL